MMNQQKKGYLKETVTKAPEIPGKILALSVSFLKTLPRGVGGISRDEPL